MRTRRSRAAWMIAVTVKVQLWVACATCALLVAALPARAQAPVAPAETPPAAPGETPLAETVDVEASRREAFFDIAVAALAQGELDVAERAFLEAAAVPGDPVRTAVASSFAERVRRLRLRRMEIDPAIRRPAPPRPRVAEVERSQRAAFLGVTSLLGLSLWGWTLPTAVGLSVDSTRRFLGVYMVTGAASFVVPHLLTRSRGVSAAQANLVLYGGTRGIWHGVLVGALLYGNVNSDRRHRTWATSMLLGSTAELTAGFFLADEGRMTPGHARAMAALGDFGFIWGVGAGYFLHFNLRETTDRQARGMAATTLVGSALGLTGGYLLGRHRQNTWGDGEVMRMGGFLGMLTGFAFADLFEEDLGLDNRPVVALAVGGSVLGVVAGDFLVRRTDFTVAQSMLIDLAAISGAMGAAGIAYLVTPQNEEGSSEPPFVMAAAMGGIAAYALSWWALRDRPEVAPAPRLSTRGLMPLLGNRGQRGLALIGTF